MGFRWRRRYFRLRRRWRTRARLHLPPELRHRNAPVSRLRKPVRRRLRSRRGDRDGIDPLGKSDHPPPLGRYNISRTLVIANFQYFVARRSPYISHFIKKRLVLARRSDKQVNSDILASLNNSPMKCLYQTIIQDFEQLVSFIKAHDPSHLLPVVYQTYHASHAYESSQNGITSSPQNTSTVRSQTKELC
jgi:hypothetical protein